MWMNFLTLSRVLNSLTFFQIQMIFDKYHANKPLGWYCKTSWMIYHKNINSLNDKQNNIKLTNEAISKKFGNWLRNKPMTKIWLHMGSPTPLTLILPCSRTGTVWFYTSTSNKRAARPKLYTKSLTRDLKLMYSRLTVVRISTKL